MPGNARVASPDLVLSGVGLGDLRIPQFSEGRIVGIFKGVVERKL